MKSPRLDNLLRQWADQHAVEAAQTAPLTTRLRAHAARHGAAPVDLWGRPASGRRLAGRAAWMLAGAAALLLLQFALRPLLQQSPTDEAPPLQALADQSLAADTAALFSQAAALFPQRLRWVAETDTGVHVEVSPEALGGAAAPETVVVRLVALAREKDTPWRVDWTAAVATTGEDVVELQLPSHGRLTLWARRLENGLAVADTGLDLSNPVVAVAASRLLRLGFPAEVLRLQTAATEYRVYQTVTSATTPRRLADS